MACRLARRASGIIRPSFVPSPPRAGEGSLRKPSRRTATGNVISGSLRVNPDAPRYVQLSAASPTATGPDTGEVAHRQRTRRTTAQREIVDSGVAELLP